MQRSRPSPATSPRRSAASRSRTTIYESDHYVLSSAVGHLLELVPPEGVEAARGKWTFKCLPVIPPHFDLQPIEKSESRLKVLAKLIKRKDVDALINACDAGREGELIFRNIVKYTKAKQPIQRLWLQSMTPAAIREGFAQLARRRLHAAAGRRRVQPVGSRLAGRHQRHARDDGLQLEARAAFSKPPWAACRRRRWPSWSSARRRSGSSCRAITGKSSARSTPRRANTPGAGSTRSFPGRSKDGDDRAEAGAVLGQVAAEAIRDKCLGKPGIVTEESKPSTSLSPLLYDLTSLQRDANSRFGFSAKNTLGLAQALYERHKVLTYPRTDSRALPEDYLGTVKDADADARRHRATARSPSTILKSDWVRPNKRIFNNAKISDHFAIIPTSLAPKDLSEPEQKLYDMVTKRFLAIFYPAAEFLETTRITRVEGEPFKSDGQGAGESGLADGLWQGSAGRRHGRTWRR